MISEASFPFCDDICERVLDEEVVVIDDTDDAAVDKRDENLPFLFFFIREMISWGVDFVFDDDADVFNISNEFFEDDDE